MAPLRLAQAVLAWTTLAAVLLRPALSSAAATGDHAAAPAAPAPASLLATVRRLMAESSCRLKSAVRLPLRWSNFAALDRRRLLLLLALPDYLCEHSNTVLPVLVDSGRRRDRWHYRWRLGKPMAGEVQQLSRTSDGTLLLATRWIVEGSYPMLYRSRDGLNWQPLTLPLPRPQPPFVSLLQLCVGERELRVLLGSETGDEAVAEAWTTPIAGLRPGRVPGWRLLGRGVGANLTVQPCEAAVPSDGGWRKSESTDGTEISYRQPGRAVVVPAVLTWQSGEQ
jgi:hypothetical protein